MPSSFNGVNAPVFSLKTETSGGIGEYLDLIPLIDWARAHGLNVIQILPINDNGLDPSPYNLQSVFALNPLLIKWPGVSDKGLNDLIRIDYDAVRDLKEKAFKAYNFPYKEVEKFRKNEKWVDTYAHFKEGEKTVCEQWLAATQMKQVKAHADKVGVKIMGDLPILVAPDSVEVKLHPHLFHLDRSAGAPPDQFTDEEQNWGCPIYNWEAMKKEDFSWWKARLKYSEHYYHMYRIDHIVGFYRIWSYPADDPNAKGAFYPKDKNVWIPHGETILKAIIDHSTMEPIGEDLGTIPKGVTESLDRLMVPGTRVLRWERFKDPPRNYIPFHRYPPLNLATVSTHDVAPLRLWWKEETKERTLFCRFMGWKNEKKISDQRIIDILKISHNTPCLYAVNLLLEYLSAVPSLRHSHPESDRINLPGKVSPKNWRFRMKPTIEQMAKSKELSRIFNDILY
ncbi:MAG: 4-alpha-glucanotransferase [Chlamydiia bacterium]|nr:4-alpha-glucanotransferase [Chlamydiia bacterium]